MNSEITSNLSKNPHSETINITWVEKPSTTREASNAGNFVRKSLPQLAREDAQLALLSCVELDARIRISRGFACLRGCLHDTGMTFIPVRVHFF